MKKSVAGQVIGAQMVTVADGSAFTGSVTVSVTGNGGTQATGSVSSGACTHEGNGFHTYAPAQAETNYDHVAFTFTGTGAIPVTVQVYPTFPQTGDSFTLIGATGSGLTSLASAANLAAAKTVVDTLATTLGTPADTDIATDIFNLLTETSAVKLKTDSLTFTKAGEIDANIQSINGVSLTGDGSGTPFNV